MKNKTWGKIINQEVSDTHRDNVLTLAQAQLQKNKTIKKPFWNWLMPLAGSGIAILLLFILMSPNPNNYSTAEILSASTIEPDELENLDIIMVLDEAIEIEEVEQWQEI